MRCLDLLEEQCFFPVTMHPSVATELPGGSRAEQTTDVPLSSSNLILIGSRLLSGNSDNLSLCRVQQSEIGARVKEKIFLRTCVPNQKLRIHVLVSIGLLCVPAALLLTARTKVSDELSAGI